MTSTAASTSEHLDAERLAWPGGPVVLGKDRLDVPCPGCRARLSPGRLHFAGMPILVETRCPSCGRGYFLDWPAGHALLHPVLVEDGSGAAYFDGDEWYARRVVRCLGRRETPERAPILTRSRETEARRAIVVDAVDFLYGHCLLKLLAGLTYARDHPDADVLVIAPRALEWLLPDVSSVLVDLPLARCDGWIAGLQEAVAQALEAYAEIELAPGSSQPDLRGAALADLLGGDFGPQEFWDEPAGTSPLVTLVLREDRVWGSEHQRLPVRLACRLLPSLRQRLLLRQQSRRYSRLVDLLRGLREDVRIAAVGIGRRTALPGDVIDLRCDAEGPAEHLERQWLGIYAESRVVVGVHGSNMLLPSALGGAVVELLPDRRLHNITQDLVIAGARDHEPKLCLFRYRIVPLSTPPETIAAVVASILADADAHHRNIVENRAARPGSGWPRPVSWRRLSA